MSQVIYACTMYDGMICIYVCTYRYIQRLYTDLKTLERENLNCGILYSGIHSTVGSDNIIFVDGPGIIQHKLMLWDTFSLHAYVPHISSLQQTDKRFRKCNKCMLHRAERRMWDISCW